jgi:RHS repeat-associated protein
VGELLQATLSDNSLVEYAYDGMGRRMARTSDMGTRTYLYGNPDIPYQVTAMRAEDGVLHVFYYDDDGVLYALDQGGERFYVGSDPVGTPKIIADASGIVVKRREFDAWGRLLADDNPGFLLPLGLAGGLFDPDTQLVRFWHRDLDTLSGHWTTHDPALYDGGQFNLTQYAGADPVNGRDPTGLWCIGFNAYVGIGGGLQICCRGGTCSACGEVGVGFGIEASAGTGGPARDGSSGFAEAGIGCGPLGAGSQCSYGDCGLQCGLKANVGPLQADTNPGVQAQSDPTGWKRFNATPGCKGSLKVGKKKCERW